MLVLEQIPMRSDNYSYALIKDNQAIIIDPSCEKDSIDYFKARPHLKLLAIFCTHSHYDHVGGNEALSKMFNCRVYGPKAESERIPCLTHAVVPHEEFSILNVRLKACDVKAHTIGHTAYMLFNPIEKMVRHGHGNKPHEVSNLAQKKVLFVGDSLFAAGCGRLFEGSYEDLYKAMEFYYKQDGQTLMAAAHEYTKKNLLFARDIFLENEAILRRLKKVDNEIVQTGSSLPCFFEEEFDTNPFLMVFYEKYRRELARKFDKDFNDIKALLRVLREAKDEF